MDSRTHIAMKRCRLSTLTALCVLLSFPAVATAEGMALLLSRYPGVAGTTG